ncbi:gluconokinase [Actinomyces bowdenii]|nr:gluconokinase [Actinomyces bowdenii]
MSRMQEPRGGARPGQVTHLVIMGVSGCGKTTAAASLSRELGWPVAEADDFHPAANIEKMASGAPLTDEDRWPWLASLRDWMTRRAGEGASTIVTCSALKRSYRDLLSGAEGRVRFIHLHVPQAQLEERMEQRTGHFMPPSLLPSQLATLEPLEADEDGIVVESHQTPELTLAAILEALQADGRTSS